MRELDRPIGRVFRRLRAQRFLATLVWALAAWLTAAAGFALVDKFAYPLPGPGWLPFAVGGGAAALTAMAVAWMSGPSRVDAAVAIDRAFGLNERLSTTLTLDERERETPFGRALVADAIKQVADLDVADKFGLTLPRRAWVPILPCLLAVVGLFAPEWSGAIGRAKGTTGGPKADREVVGKKSEALREKIAVQRKEMDKGKFAEAEKLLAEVERAAGELAKAPPGEKDKALVALNKLTDAVKDRQKALGSPEQMNRQLQQMKDMNNNGPAGEFMKDLAKGNFEKAAKDLKTLQEKILAGKLSEPEKKALKDQLAEMSKQLKEAANLDKRKEQLEQAKKSGGISQEQYEKESAKLEERRKNLANLQRLADQLAKAGEQMNAGDAKKAAEALGMGQKQMEEMARQMQEMQSLDSALAEVQEAKDGMNGADQLNQFGEGMSPSGRESRNRGKGNGRGRGQGEGDRPEAEDDVSFYSTKTKQQVTKGKAVFEGFAPGTRQVKGQSVQLNQAEAETASGNSAEALSNQKVPRSVEKHVRGYFDAIGKGQP